MDYQYILRWTLEKMADAHNALIVIKCFVFIVICSFSYMDFLIAKRASLMYRMQRPIVNKILLFETYVMYFFNIVQYAYLSIFKVRHISIYRLSDPIVTKYKETARLGVTGAPIKNTDRALTSILYSADKQCYSVQTRNNTFNTKYIMYKIVKRLDVPILIISVLAETNRSSFDFRDSASGVNVEVTYKILSIIQICLQFYFFGFGPVEVFLLIGTVLGPNAISKM
ncbi:hypothetical protein HUJ05_002733 [Dendroctonus ponderosae]|nr:hypothetical protein HUJ05_002733 [Dendroctonus ponderosae]